VCIYIQTWGQTDKEERERERERDTHTHTHTIAAKGLSMGGNSQKKNEKQMIIY
jgi:hypothetical protein